MARTREQHREYMRAWRKRGRWLRDAREGACGPREFEWRSPLHPAFATVVLMPRTTARRRPRFMEE